MEESYLNENFPNPKSTTGNSDNTYQADESTLGLGALLKQQQQQQQDSSSSSCSAEIECTVGGVRSASDDDDVICTTDVTTNGGGGVVGVVSNKKTEDETMDDDNGIQELKKCLFDTEEFRSINYSEPIHIFLKLKPLDLKEKLKQNNQVG
jgi:hypothetical protein